MTDIHISVHNVRTTRNPQITLSDSSGAHTELTLYIEGNPPIAAAFNYREGSVSVPVDLPPGLYSCRFFVQAYHYRGDGTLNPTYDVECRIDNMPCAAADGSFLPDTSASGVADFELEVV